MLPRPTSVSSIAPICKGLSPRQVIAPTRDSSSHLALEPKHARERQGQTRRRSRARAPFYSCSASGVPGSTTSKSGWIADTGTMQPAEFAKSSTARVGRNINDAEHGRRCDAEAMLARVRHAAYPQRSMAENTGGRASIAKYRARVITSGRTSISSSRWLGSSHKWQASSLTTTPSGRQVTTQRPSMRTIVSDARIRVSSFSRISVSAPGA